MKKFIALLMAALLTVSAFGGLAGCSKLQEPGKVTFLNCVPEAGEAWQKLASAYSDIYGVEVTVRTAANDDCAATLKAALSGDGAPTLFQFHSAADFEALKTSCLDLTGTAALGQMVTGQFNFTDGGAVKAMGYSYDAFGILVNRALLESAGYQLTGIQNFATLKAAAEDIHSRTEELGFDAFAALGAEDAALWQLAEASRFCADPGFYYRQFLDLYILNSSQPAEQAQSTTDIGLSQFAAGQAVFCLYDASVFNTLVGDTYRMEPGSLAIIPVYFGAEGEETTALCCTARSYLAVNSAASDADRQATLDFLNWVVASEYGMNLLQEQFGGVPFKGANAGFYGSANALLADGKTAVTCRVDYGEEQMDDLTTALANYAADHSDDNWQNVMNAIYPGEDLT